jgi:cation diffusion facilitator family transporter
MTDSDCSSHAPALILDQGRGSQATARAVRRVFLFTLAVNAAVALAKGLYGYVSGSVAVGTDAVHAALDAASNVLALLGLHWSQAPANPRRPYGHRKIELVVALGIGVLIVAGLAELTTAAIRGLTGERPPPRIGAGGFLIVAATMVVNFFVTRYEDRNGHALGSPLLCADAQHTRSDLYASAAVILSFVGVRVGWAWADAAGALFVVVMVGRAAWMVFRDNIPALIDTAVLDPTRVAAVAEGVLGIRNLHRIRSRGHPNAVHVDLHMEVDPEMTVAAAHELVDRIERDLRARFPEISDVVVHVEPAPSGP